jgi:uncharacterized protein (DUF1800 family)
VAGALPDGLLVARRFSFGPTPDLVDMARGDASAFFDSQLSTDLAESAPVQALLDAHARRLEQAQLDAGPDGGGKASAANSVRRASIEAVIGSTLAASAWSARQLRHVMADVWADHLHVSISDGASSHFVPTYDRDVVLTHALGRFSDLLVASARSAAMLVFLDNASSRADGGRVPNENYGRELLELHTVGVDGGYDEDDVVAVAHVLSGWGVVRGSGEFTFRAQRHDLGPIADGGDILGWTPTARGVQDGEDLLRHLAAHPATARHVCWKLARRFVSDEVAPDDELVARLVSTYLAEDTAVGPVLRELAASNEMSRSAGAKLRRPFDLVAAMLRLGTAVPSPSDWDRPARTAGRILQQLGHVPYGWPGPDGYPEVAAAWSGPGALTARWNAAFAAAGGFDGLEIPAAIAAGADAGVATSVLGVLPGPELVAALDRLPPGDAGAARSARELVFASPEFQLR